MHRRCRGTIWRNWQRRWSDVPICGWTSRLAITRWDASPAPPRDASVPAPAPLAVADVAVAHADEAEEATQQVFVKLITNIGQFRGTADFSTWLYRLVVNTCLDGARRARARAARLATEIEPDTLASAGSQEEDLIRAQRARLVQDALSALPPKFRLPLLLRYFEDLSYEEMAEVLHCSMGTIASRLNRGHKMLASKLEVLRRS